MANKLAPHQTKNMLKTAKPHTYTNTRTHNINTYIDVFKDTNKI